MTQAGRIFTGSPNADPIVVSPDRGVGPQNLPEPGPLALLALLLLGSAMRAALRRPSREAPGGQAAGAGPPAPPLRTGG